MQSHWTNERAKRENNEKQIFVCGCVWMCLTTIATKLCDRPESKISRTGSRAQNLDRVRSWAKSISERYVLKALFILKINHTKADIFSYFRRLIDTKRQPIKDYYCTNL